MQNRLARIGVLAFLAAGLAAFFVTPGSWEYFKFKIGNYDQDGETQAVIDTIKLFSGTYAGFYDTGGSLAGLNMFPAGKMIKRRIFQDLDILNHNGLVLAADRDRSDVRQILFADRSHAVAVVDESWFLAYQNAETRRPVSGNKADIITVRYLLKKMWNRWIVVDYEVYGRNDNIPPVRKERFLEW